MSVLLAAEVNNEKLSDLHLSAFFMLLQNAGSETTRNLITTGTLALLQRPDQLERLRADFSLLPTAIEELLRHSHAGDVVHPHRGDRHRRSPARRSGPAIMC